MIDVSAEVEGAAEVRAGFDAAATSVRGRVRESLIRAGGMVRDAARGTTAFKDGPNAQLRNSINMRLAEDASRGVLSVTIKPSDHVGLFLEGGVVNYGTSGNKRTVVGRRASAADKQRRVRFREALAAQGGWRIEPRPFMAPAWASVRDRVANMLEAAVGQGIEKAGG